MNNEEFQVTVLTELGILRERTNDLPQIRKDISSMVAKTASLEARASIFGAMAGGAFAAGIAYIKSLFGRS